MSKNQKNINKSSNKSPVKVEKPKFVHNKKAYLIIFVLTFLLYGNTIRNNYALDDLIVITENKFTIQGFDGIKSILTEDMFMGYYGNMSLVQGSRYRPLSLVTFAIEYQFFKKNPHVGHFINILLFAFTGILIFMVLSKLLIKFKSKQCIAGFIRSIMVRDKIS